MANISVTAASVATISNTKEDKGQAGVAVTQGQAVYLSTTDNKWYLSDANVTAARTARTGIVMTPAGIDEYFTVQQTAGANIKFGATLVKGTTYVVSATAGAICPQADLTSGDAVIVLGVASSTSVLVLAINNTGIVL